MNRKQNDRTTIDYILKELRNTQLHINKLLKDSEVPEGQKKIQLELLDKKERYLIQQMGILKGVLGPKWN